MTVTIEQTEKILKGDYRFSQLGFSMLVTRLKSLYAVSPNQAVLQSSMNEINAFLKKFQSIMASDCETLSNI